MSKNRILVVETRLQHWSGHVNFQGLPQVEAPFCAPHSLTWLRRALPPPNMPTSRSMQSFANCWELSATGPICLYRGEKRHAFDHSNYHFDSVADWSIANLAVQRRLGLLSRRRAWAYSHYRNHSGADGPYLNTSLLLKWRLGAR
jgi:hypothetical protein